MKPIGATVVVGILVALAMLLWLDIKKPQAIVLVTVLSIWVVGVVVKTGMWIYKKAGKHV